MSADALGLLDQAAASQRELLRSYERPSEVLALETVRALDHLFCRELFPERDRADPELDESRIMCSGVNHALRRILPRRLGCEPFRLFPSTLKTQAKANEFLFACGALALAERQANLLSEGLLSADVQTLGQTRSAPATRILALTAAHSSAYAEAIGRRGQRWSSTQCRIASSAREEELERRHLVIMPELERNVGVSGGWTMRYARSAELDAYFLEWAEIYLARMSFQDMISPEAVIGGRPFGAYLEVLRRLSALSQMRLCFAGLAKHRTPNLSFRNLLTGVSGTADLVRDLAAQLDADTLDVQRLAAHLTLSPANMDFHLDRQDTAWAPLIQTSSGFCLLPSYGLEINPFLFLLNELRCRHPEDWFRIANEREGLWLTELEQLFSGEHWRTNRRNVKLRRGRNAVTDIDFAAFDASTGELGVFQLKWQQPVNADPRIRRSTASNLLTESNRWIAAVTGWIEEFGSAELAEKLGLRTAPDRIRLFVLARYGAHFSGYDGRDGRAVWADWSHFRKARQENLSASVCELAELVGEEIAAAASAVQPESYAVPLPGLAVVVNPLRVPA